MQEIKQEQVRNLLRDIYNIRNKFNNLRDTDNEIVPEVKIDINNLFVEVKSLLEGEDGF